MYTVVLIWLTHIMKQLKTIEPIFLLLIYKQPLKLEYIDHYMKGIVTYWGHFS